MGFALRQGISFCRVGNRIIFLDILADRYFCLAPGAERHFSAWVEGGDPAPQDAQLQGLLAHGLLTPSTSSQAPTACGAIRIPQTSILDLGLPAPGGAATIRALCGLTYMRLRLKTTGLGRTLAWLSRRKAGLPTSSMPSDAHVAQIMAGFIGASRFATQLDNCLAHSLAVASTMIAKDLQPDIVLGVQLGPFSAHCWVQHDDRLVNDRFDMVRTFTPILVL